MSGTHVRISTETIEAISKLSNGEMNNREFIENLVAQRLSGQLIHKDTLEEHTPDADDDHHLKESNFSQIHDDIKRLTVMTKLMGLHLFDDNDGVQNALKLLSQSVSNCIQCNTKMTCPKCGCFASDHLDDLPED